MCTGGLLSVIRIRGVDGKVGNDVSTNCVAGQSNSKLYYLCEDSKAVIKY